MRRIVSLLLLLLLLSSIVVASYCWYVCVQKNSGAVPSALLAGFTSLNPYTIRYAGTDSNEACLQAYLFLKRSTDVHWIGDSADSCYSPGDNIVYLTHTAFMENSAEAAHEFGHVLDRCLYGENAGYFSRQVTFSQAYAADCADMQSSFHMQDLFETEVYRNLAVSDILFAVFYEDGATTKTLAASYDAAGVPYWRHETEYMAGLGERQTEVFADIFTIYLSDDALAKQFAQMHLPRCTEVLLCAVESRSW